MIVKLIIAALLCPLLLSQPLWAAEAPANSSVEQVENPCPNDEPYCPITSELCKQNPNICKSDRYYRSPPGTPPCNGAVTVESECSWLNQERVIECLTAWDTSDCK